MISSLYILLGSLLIIFILLQIKYTNPDPNDKAEREEKIEEEYQAWVNLKKDV